MLQAAGVPAGMVQRSSDHLQDPQLAHRAFFRRLQHPEMGEVPYEGHQYAIGGYDNGPRLPGAVPRRAHLRGAHRGPRPRRRRGRRGPRQRRLRLRRAPRRCAEPAARGSDPADPVTVAPGSNGTGGSATGRLRCRRMEIKDRVAIITGGGGGIGSAVARRWMADGARAVVVADRNGDAARAVGAEIGCLGVELDVTDEAAIVALVERSRTRSARSTSSSPTPAPARAAGSRRRTRPGRRSGSCT